LVEWLEQGCHEVGCLASAIARGSAQECVPRLEIARRRGLVKDPTALALKKRLEVIAKMISGLINGLDRRDG
jgi:four helix bundle protein